MGKLNEYKAKFEKELKLYKESEAELARYELLKLRDKTTKYDDLISIGKKRVAARKKLLDEIADKAMGIVERNRIR